MPSATVDSPCIKACRLNPDNYCTGCLRHLDEIKAWRSLGATERRQLLTEIEKRKCLAKDFIPRGPFQTEATRFFCQRM